MVEKQSKPNRVESLKAKYGEDYFKRIGSRGGKKSNPNKGFGCPVTGKGGLTGPERAVKSGQKSRRTKRKKEE